MPNILASIIYSFGIIFFILALVGKAEITLLFLIPLFPLQNILARLQQFPLGKDFTDFLLIAIIIGWFVRALSKGEKIIDVTNLNFPLFLFIVFTYVSLWHGSFYMGLPAPINALDGRVQNWKNYMILPLLYFIIVNNIKNLKQIKWLVIVMVLSMLLMDHYCIKQIRWMSGLASRDKLDGTFIWLGPNEVAAFYAQYTLVLLGIFILNKEKFNRILSGIVILLNTYCLLFLFSRGAYIATLGGLIIISLFKSKKLLLPLILLLFLWQTILPATVVERINQTKTEDGTLESSAETRVELWQQSMETFEKEPLFGVGFSIFPYMGFLKDDPHNIYVKTLLEQGIIGMMILLILFWLAFKNGWRLYKMADDNFLKGLGLGFTACVAATMISNIFGERWSYVQLGAYYWVFLGLVARGNIIVQEELKSKIRLKKK